MLAALINTPLHLKESRADRILRQHRLAFEDIDDAVLKAVLAHIEQTDLVATGIRTTVLAATSRWINLRNLNSDDAAMFSLFADHVRYPALGGDHSFGTSHLAGSLEMEVLLDPDCPSKFVGITDVRLIGVDSGIARQRQELPFRKQTPVGCSGCSARKQTPVGILLGILENKPRSEFWDFEVSRIAANRLQSPAIALATIESTHQFDGNWRHGATVWREMTGKTGPSCAISRASPDLLNWSTMKIIKTLTLAVPLLVALCAQSAQAEDTWSKTIAFSKSDASAIKVFEPEGYKASITIDGKIQSDAIQVLLKTPNTDGFYTVTITAPNGVSWKTKVETKKFAVTELRVKHIIAAATAVAPAKAKFFGKIALQAGGKNNCRVNGTVERIDFVNEEGVTAASASILDKAISIEVPGGTYAVRRFHIDERGNVDYRTTTSVTINGDGWSGIVQCGKDNSVIFKAK